MKVYVLHLTKINKDYLKQTYTEIIGVFLNSKTAIIKMREYCKANNDCGDDLIRKLEITEVNII